MSRTAINASQIYDSLICRAYHPTVIEDIGDCFVATHKDYTLEIDKNVPRISSETLNMWLESVDGEPPKLSKGVQDNWFITYADVYPGVDAAISLRDGSVAIQKIIKRKGVASEFVVAKQSTEQWETMRDAAGRDNWVGKNARRSKFDMRHPLIVDVVIEEKDGVVRNVQRFEGRALKRDIKTRVQSETTDLIYPVCIHATENLALVRPDDFDYDGKEENNNWSRNYGLNNFRMTYGGGGPRRIMGVVFDVSNVPQGATIDAATLKLEAQAGVKQGTVYGDADITDSIFGASDRPSQMTQTTASAETGAIPASGVDLEVDVANIVQECVNNAGWTIGQKIRFGIWPQPGYGTSRFQPADDVAFGTSGNPPRLDITWSSGGPVGSAIPVILQTYAKNLG